MLRRNFLAGIPALCLAPLVLPKTKIPRKYFKGKITPGIRWKLLNPPSNIFGNGSRLKYNKLGLRLECITFESLPEIPTFRSEYTDYCIVSHFYKNKYEQLFGFHAEPYENAQKIEQQKKVLEEQWGYDSRYEYIHYQWTHYEPVTYNAFTRILKSDLYNC